MKRLILIAAVSIMAQAAIAQQTPSAEPGQSKMERKEFRKKGKHKKTEMMKQLNLSDEQKSKLHQMRAANKQQREAIKSDSKLTEAQKKEKMKTLKEQQKSGLESILNDEQKTKMKEMKTKMKKEQRYSKKRKADNTKDVTATMR